MRWHVMVVGAAALAVSGAASAHGGHGGGFGTGLLHPLAGWDHLLAAFAVGLWAARHTGRRTLLLPAMFLAAMAVGVALGVSGVGLPALEPIILLSLVVLGGALAVPRQPPLAAAAALLGTFALFHGQAHALDAGVGQVGAAYLAALLLATALLHGAGVFAGRLAHPLVLRVGGAAIGGAGLWMLAIG